MEYVVQGTVYKEGFGTPRSVCGTAGPTAQGKRGVTCFVLYHRSAGERVVINSCDCAVGRLNMVVQYNTCTRYAETEQYVGRAGSGRELCGDGARSGGWC